VDESGRQIGVGKAGYNSSKIETEKLAEKQRPLVHYDYLYLDNK
jgi:glutamate 5-kinase